MGWHYILTFRCKILSEYTEFIEKEYLQKFFDEDTDIHYKSEPYRRYSSSDDCSEAREEREQISQWEREDNEERDRIDAEYKVLPKFYKDLIDIWCKLCIGNHFYKYDFKEEVFYCQISKKVNWHDGDLRDDYETFLKDIIVPISSEITFCEIESDDYGDMKWYYSDSQLRNIYFRLEDKIKGAEHVYSEDGSEIVETRVIYKHSIKPLHYLDLNRVYGIKGSK
jgi:hypothetical protein